jgi:hypothetical protein
MTPGPEEDLRARAEARVKAREDFRTHLLVYVLVNLLLWGIWYLNPTPAGVPWPLYASVGWGIGIAVHWYSVYGINTSRREAEIEREMRRLRGDRD